MFKSVSAVIIPFIILAAGTVRQSAAFHVPVSPLVGSASFNTGTGFAYCTPKDADGVTIVLAQNETPPDIKTGVPGDESVKSSSEARHDEIAALRQRIIELQNRSKLGFRKIVPCRAVEGFGLYSPIEPDKPFSRIVLYVEPSNVNTLVSGDRYIIDCTIDVFVTDATGKSVAGKESAFKINKVSRSPVMDLYFKLDINFSKPITRDIVVKIVIRDNLKNESASISQRINVASSTTKESSLHGDFKIAGKKVSSTATNLPPFSDL